MIRIAATDVIWNWLFPSRNHDDEPDVIRYTEDCMHTADAFLRKLDRHLHKTAVDIAKNAGRRLVTSDDMDDAIQILAERGLPDGLKSVDGK
jgi:histone H3/H4